MSIITDFIGQYGALANNAAEQTGLSQSEVLGQWGLETGWGKKFAGTNNMGNVSPGGKVANYDTPSAGVQAYVNALKYEKIDGYAYATDPAAFGAALKSAGYATDPDYASKIAGAVDSVNRAQGFKTITQIMDTNIDTGKSGAGSGSPNDLAQKAVDNPVSNFFNYVGANVGLVFFGGVLIVGALLISQKDTVIKIAKTV